MPHRGYSESNQGRHGGETEIQEAYHRGIRGAERRKRPSLSLKLANFFLCAIGALILVLSFYKGSFTEGGMMIDRQIAAARGQSDVPMVSRSQTETNDLDGDWQVGSR